METIHARALETENRVRMLETDGMRLSLYQNMLTNISTQATLLLGFALATYGADLLPYILNDESTFCIFKSPARMVIGSIFLQANTCCLCFCLLTVISSSMLMLYSQNNYLHVGGEAAVWRTAQLSKFVYGWYGKALLCFLLDAVLLLWIFLGLPLWVDHPMPGLGGADVITRKGVEMVRCLDIEDDDAHQSRAVFGLSNALVSTIAFGLFTIYGVSTMRGFVRQFKDDELRGPDAVAKEIKEWRARNALDRQEAMASCNYRDATKALQRFKKQHGKREVAAAGALAGSSSSGGSGGSGGSAGSGTATKASAAIAAELAKLQRNKNNAEHRLKVYLEHKSELRREAKEARRQKRSSSSSSTGRRALATEVQRVDVLVGGDARRSSTSTMPPRESVLQERSAARSSDDEVDSTH